MTGAAATGWEDKKCQPPGGDRCFLVGDGGFTPAGHKLRLHLSPPKKYPRRSDDRREYLVGDGGFEPPKALPADLQSVPFGHSGNPPYSLGAGGRIRTPDLLITNQLLYRLSYTSVSAATILLYHSPGAKSSPKIQFFAAKQDGSRPTGQGAAVYSPSGRSQLSMCSSR